MRKAGLRQESRKRSVKSLSKTFGVLQKFMKVSVIMSTTVEAICVRGISKPISSVPTSLKESALVRIIMIPTERTIWTTSFSAGKRPAMKISLVLSKNLRNSRNGPWWSPPGDREARTKRPAFYRISSNLFPVSQRSGLRRLRPAKMH